MNNLDSQEKRLNLLNPHNKNFSIKELNNLFSNIEKNRLDNTKINKKTLFKIYDIIFLGETNITNINKNFLEPKYIIKYNSIFNLLIKILNLKR